MTDLKELDESLTEVIKRYDSLLEYEKERFIPSRVNLGGLEKNVDDIKEEIERCVDDNRAELILKNYLEKTADSLMARLKNDRAFPNRYLRSLSGKMNDLVSFDDREVAETSSILSSILDRSGEIVEFSGVYAKRVDAERKDMFLNDLDGLESLLKNLTSECPDYFEKLDEEKRRKIKGGMEDLVGEIKEISAEVEEASLLPEREQIDAHEYANTLKQIYDIDVNELLDWHREEVKRREKELRQVAEEIDPDRAPFEILEEDLTSYDSPEEMYEAMEGYLETAREEALEYISLPEGENCEVWRVPEFLKDSYPWGGYHGKNPLRGELKGAVFLNQHNYEEINEGWVKLNAVHECYPGHHAHAVKTTWGDMPSIFKANSALTSPGAPLTEGVAVRSERLLEEVFGDGIFPLFVAYRRLHTSVRVWADLILHYYEKGEEAAVELYKDRLDFSEEEARGQVRAHKLTPGYFTVYYYGLKKLNDLQEDCGWGDERFTELIFSSGKVSIETVRDLIEAPEEEREKLIGNYSDGLGS